MTVMTIDGKGSIWWGGGVAELSPCTLTYARTLAWSISTRVCVRMCVLARVAVVEDEEEVVVVRYHGRCQMNTRKQERAFTDAPLVEAGAHADNFDYVSKLTKTCRGLFSRESYQSPSTVLDLLRESRVLSS